MRGAAIRLGVRSAWARAGPGAGRLPMAVRAGPGLARAFRVGDLARQRDNRDHRSRRRPRSRGLVVRGSLPLTIAALPVPRRPLATTRPPPCAGVSGGRRQTTRTRLPGEELAPPHSASVALSSLSLPLPLSACLAALSSPPRPRTRRLSLPSSFQARGGERRGRGCRSSGSCRAFEGQNQQDNEKRAITMKTMITQQRGCGVEVECA